MTYDRDGLSCCDQCNRWISSPEFRRDGCPYCRIAVLEKVIEWACKNQGRFSNIAGATKPNSMFVEEMRRRSKGGGIRRKHGTDNESRY